MDDDSLEVSGKLDHIAGGMPKYEQAENEVNSLGLPEIFTKITNKILNHFKEEYPQGLPMQGIEVKSTSSFGIEKVYFTGFIIGITAFSKCKNINYNVAERRKFCY